MDMQIVLDSKALDEAIFCYLNNKLRDVDTYDISIDLVAGRSGNKPKGNVTLTRKADFSHMDNTAQAIPDTDEVVEEEKPHITPTLFRDTSE